MYHLRLIKGKSYWGIVQASEKNPDVYVPEKFQAEKLIASGFFVLVDDDSKEGVDNLKDEAEENYDAEFYGDEEEQSTPIVNELDTMKVDELKEYANAKGIDITGCTKKDDIYQRIIQEIAKADDARKALRQE